MSTLLNTVKSAARRALSPFRFTTRELTAMAILSALAFVVMLVGRFPFVPTVEFLKYDPKDVIIVIGGFMFGPAAALTVSLVVSIVEMLTVSGTGFIGLFMNVLSSSAFAVTAAFIYKRMRSAKGAVIGLLAGVLLATGVMLLWNYIITPLYMNAPRAEVVKLMLPGFLPYNLIKGGVNAALTLLIYKPLMKGLRAAHLLPRSEGSGGGGGVTLGITVAALVLLATLILLVLALRGII